MTTFKPWVKGMVWDRSFHRVPTPETDRIDSVLNKLAKNPKRGILSDYEERQQAQIEKHLWMDRK